MGNKRFKKGEDRISCLPDQIISHILSFLPTKYAVGTSILSTRWKYLFSLSPNLDFDDHLWLHPLKSTSSVRKNSIFMNFVDRVMMLSNLLSIDRFHLTSKRVFSFKHILQDVLLSRLDAWICAALRRNIRELDLSISFIDPTLLPRDIFMCQTLVVLKLSGDFILKAPPKVFLPNLKILSLTSIQLRDDSIRSLISGCPVLEDLIIQKCDGFDEIPTIDIRAPALKRFTLDNCPFNGDNEHSKQKLVLNIPNLVYLSYTTNSIPERFLVNLSSLVRAHIDVGYGSISLEDKIPHKESVAEILQGISKVQSSHLSGDFIHAIEFYNCAIPIFSNLTHLELGIDNFVTWRLLPDLLLSLPILKTLVFVDGLVWHDKDGCKFEFEVKSSNWDQQQFKPTCLLYHLKTIEIKSFEGYEAELNIVKYLLKNGRVLNRMIIYTQIIDAEEKWNVGQELLKFARGSQACQVVCDHFDD